jgi:hypothetical protein
MIILLKLLFYISLLTHSVTQAAKLTGVFTGITSDSPDPGNVFLPTETAILSWSIDPTTAKKGDTFSINMPDVFSLYIHKTIVLDNGESFATCVANTGGGITAASSIDCTVVLDPSLYSSLSGTYKFRFQLDGGRKADLYWNCCFLECRFKHSKLGWFDLKSGLGPWWIF